MVQPKSDKNESQDARRHDQEARAHPDMKQRKNKRK